jgi:hypothetical protein
VVNLISAMIVSAVCLTSAPLRQIWQVEEERVSGLIVAARGAKMRQKTGLVIAPAAQVVKEIRRVARRQFSAEDKIRIVLEGHDVRDLRREASALK